MTDPIRDGIQRYLERFDDDWSISHFVISMGLERIRDGQLETCTWQYYPAGQPTYITHGLLDATQDALIDHDEDL